MPTGRKARTHTEINAISFIDSRFKQFYPTAIHERHFRYMDPNRQFLKLKVVCGNQLNRSFCLYLQTKNIPWCLQLYGLSQLHNHNIFSRFPTFRFYYLVEVILSNEGKHDLLLCLRSIQLVLVLKKNYLHNRGVFKT